ncbi:MAG: DUF3501 family protein [Sandaracinaceae bacterium]
MTPVERSEILDYVTYEEKRPEIRASAMRAKDLRRVTVGDCFTFLFENHETVRYQILEMVRAEKIVREADILHEIATYNEFLPDPGKLGCSLLIGIEDEAERNDKLRAWKGLLGHIYAKSADGRRIRPTWDPRQVGDDRLSSVQYLVFELGGEPPTAIGLDFPGLEAETELGEETRVALGDDLAA